jgi:FkbM family methyltransferase
VINKIKYYRFRANLVSHLINLNENLIFNKRLKKVYLNLLKGNEFKTIVDVGVNKGQSIQFFKKLNKRVKIIGFEPNKKLYESLKKRKYKYCDLYNLGCSSQNGHLRFYENILNESSTFEKVNSSSEWLKKKEKVLGVSLKNMIIDTYEIPVIRLADFLNTNYNNKKIDLVKIDVEGHEYDALQGLFPLKNQIKYIQLEEHGDDLYLNNKKEIVKLLQNNNFEKAESIKHGFGEIYDVIYKNKML